MLNLLSANLSRLWKNKVFWLCLSAMLLLSTGYMASCCPRGMAMKAEGYQVVLDGYYFNLAPVPGLLLAIFTGMFLGTEYSDGAIRNKVMVGHTRTGIYLASLLTCMTGSFLIVLAWLAGGLVGIPVFGLWQMSPSALLGYLLIALLFSAALCGIFTLVGMLSSHKAATAVLSILLFLGLLICASIVYNKLGEPETVSGVIMTAGGIQLGDPTPNPDYVGGTLRTVLQVILNILPTGQGILMANTETAQPVWQILSSLLLTLGTTALGILLFGRKDLK